MIEKELAPLFTPVYDRTIVTGGGSGMGRIVALSPATMGNAVYVRGRRVAELHETVALAAPLQGGGIALPFDMTHHSKPKPKRSGAGDLPPVPVSVKGRGQKDIPACATS